jgi:protein TonB
MATLRRPLLISLALHAVAALLIVAAGARPPAAELGAAPAEVTLGRPAPPALVDVEVDVAGRSGGAAIAAAAARRARPARAARTLALAPAAVLSSPVTVPEQPPSAPEPTPTATAADETPAALVRALGGADDSDGAGEGAGTGDGAGSGDGSGPLEGGGQPGRELHARVLGDVTIDVRPRDGTPILSHDEATALRVRDAFPRLPEALWTPWKPYIVALEVCVGPDGAVSEAVLRSSAAPRLDQTVLAAVKTWRYRPHVVGGQPTPFCHGVVIKYERW